MTSSYEQETTTDHEQNGAHDETDFDTQSIHELAQDDSVPDQHEIVDGVDGASFEIGVAELVCEV